MVVFIFPCGQSVKTWKVRTNNFKIMVIFEDEEAEAGEWYLKGTQRRLQLYLRQIIFKVICKMAILTFVNPGDGYTVMIYIVLHTSQFI